MRGLTTGPTESERMGLPLKICMPLFRLSASFKHGTLYQTFVPDGQSPIHYYTPVNKPSLSLWYPQFANDIEAK